jgi:transposase
MVWVMLKGLHDQLESKLEKLLVVTEERDLLKRKLYGSKRERTASGKPKSEGKKPPKVRDSDRPRLETTELPEEIQKHASYEEVLREVSQAPLIHADETPQPFTAEGKTRRGYFWVFAHERFSAYVFSKTRSGDVPHVYLKDTEGHIVVDGYTGYNSVTTPKGRKRVGCLAHMRRKFYEALVSDETVAPQILSLIKEVYAFEGKIKTQGQQGTEAHLTARQKESKPFMNQLKALIDEHRPRTPPKSMLAKALTYAHNQWSTLILFLDDLTIPLDNNHAERLLRRIALARKTSLFIKPDLGESYAIAYSLVQSCRLCGVNPEIYLADVLLKVQTPPQQQLRSLLPDRWEPLMASPRWVGCDFYLSSSLSA